MANVKNPECAMSLLTRRNLLKSAAVLAASGTGITLASRFGAAFASPAPIDLVAQNAVTMLNGTVPTQGVMTWGKDGMPPTLRAIKGQPFAARLINRLDEPTTIHWHGVRVPNAMDGVPFLTQPYIYTDDSFDYAFSPPDAGTFWYHPHCNTLTQMGRGMTGLLIVENPDDPVFDAEFPLNLRDFRLNGTGAFIEQFKLRDSAKTGTYGTVKTTNWQQQPVMDAPAGGLVRLRIAATDVTRIYTLALEGASGLVVALDGNPVDTPFPLDVYDLGCGQRMDLIVRMPDEEGAMATLSNVRGSAPFVVAQFRSVGQSLKRDLRDVPPLAANPVPEPDLSAATTIPFEFTATAEAAAKDSICGSIGATFWAINKVPWPGDIPDPTAPLAELKLGKTYLLQMVNRTPHAHPIHLHGMSFRVRSSSKRAVLPLVTDTYLIQPDEVVELALVADNIGDWVFHCHVIEHQKTGMTGFLRVV
jgi:FtsP/CotA-like multicopper oxidase with cupredoxin domain